MPTISVTICCRSCFLRYLSDNYESAARKELGRDYPAPAEGERRAPLAIWYESNVEDVPAFEKQMRLKVHYVIEPPYLWSSIYEMARTQHDDLLDTLWKGFKYIEEKSFESTFQGLFSEINLHSEKPGKTPKLRNEKLCAIIKKIAAAISRHNEFLKELGLPPLPHTEKKQ